MRRAVEYGIAVAAGLAVVGAAWALRLVLDALVDAPPYP